MLKWNVSHYIKNPIWEIVSTEKPGAGLHIFRSISVVIMAMQESLHSTEDNSLFSKTMPAWRTGKPSIEGNHVHSGIMLAWPAPNINQTKLASRTAAASRCKMLFYHGMEHLEIGHRKSIKFILYYHQINFNTSLMENSSWTKLPLNIFSSFNVTCFSLSLNYSSDPKTIFHLVSFPWHSLDGRAYGSSCWLADRPLGESLGSRM